jgi:hypothetical protein
MRHKNPHFIRYGPSRKSFPDYDHQDHHHHNQVNDTSHMLANGFSTTGKTRLYSSNRQRTISAGSGNHFKRTVPERKEDAVKFFDIEMDKSPFYQYRPGEEISGSVHMDIHHNVEIRYVELLIEGHGTITLVKPKAGLPSTARECYLRKHTFLIGTGDAAWSSVLTPGHYMS